MELTIEIDHEAEWRQVPILERGKLTDVGINGDQGIPAGRDRQLREAITTDQRRRFEQQKTRRTGALATKPNVIDLCLCQCGRK